MGWDLIRDTTKLEAIETMAGTNATFTVLKQSVKTDHAWQLIVHNKSNEKFIRLIELEQQRGTSDWAVKILSEESNPYAYDCPLSYLKSAPVTCQAWRDDVLHIANVKRRKSKLGAGDTVKLADNLSVHGKSIGLERVTIESKVGRGQFQVRSSAGPVVVGSRQFDLV